MIEFGKIGQILKGRDAGQFIEVEFDEENTGGYYIYQSNVRDFSSIETYDAWVETRGDLDGFFEESGWVIDWEI